jgi:hypothetical protein
MRTLAPDYIWQFWSHDGRSGNKPAFKLQMTKLYRIVCGVFTKILTSDIDTANSTLSEYLKHCTNPVLTEQSPLTIWPITMEPTR